MNDIDTHVTVVNLKRSVTHSMCFLCHSGQGRSFLVELNGVWKESLVKPKLCNFSRMITQKLFTAQKNHPAQSCRTWVDLPRATFKTQKKFQIRKLWPKMWFYHIWALYVTYDLIGQTEIAKNFQSHFESGKLFNFYNKLKKMPNMVKNTNIASVTLTFGWHWQNYTVM